MSQIKLILSILIFSLLLGITSSVKTQTRIIEKKIYKIEHEIAEKGKDLHETQLDYVYLSSPINLSKKIEEFALIDYVPMEFSKIYLNYYDFINVKKKISILKTDDKKKNKKK